MLGLVPSPLVSPVFVGRTAELSRLDRGLNEAGEGTPRVILLGGEAGIGKTRLLNEFLDRAADAGAVTVVGSCLELGAESLPFAPVSAALRGLFRELGDELAQAVAGREQDLSWLLPDLAPGTRPAETVDRVRLFELTLRLLENISADRTIVIAFEDLHWADSSTRELLAFWTRLLRTGRILIVGTYRADAVDRRHPLRLFLAEMERMAPKVARRELSRLTRAQVSDQLRGILGEDPGRRIVKQIFQKSEGNAFFVEELSCGVRDGRLTGGLSDTLRDLLLIRVEELPEDAQRIARLISVSGESAHHRMLACVAGFGDERLEAALRAGLARHVFTTTEEGGYRFRHALVREVVRDDLLPGERARLNATLAESMEQDPQLVGAGEYDARLAAHWYHAGRPERALPAVLRAAAGAERRFAFRGQVNLLGRALDLWEQVADPEALTGTTQLEVIREAVAASWKCSALNQTLALIRQGIDVADSVGDVRTAALLWAEKARALRHLCRSSGLPELLRAKALLEGLPLSFEQVKVLSQISTVEMLGTKGAAAVPGTRAALKLAVTLGDKALQADLRKTLGCLLVNDAALVEGLAEMEHAERLAVESGEAEIQCMVLGNKASLLEGLGRHREAVETARRGAAVGEERGLNCGIGAYVVGNLTESLFSLGEWDEVQSITEPALELDPSPSVVRSLDHKLLMLDLARGRLAAAAERLETIKDNCSTRYREAQYAIPVAETEIILATAQGRLREAREALTEALAAGLPRGYQRYGFPLLVAGARAESAAAVVDPAPREAEARTRRDVLRRIREAAAALVVVCPLDEAHRLTVEAELARTDADLWSAAFQAWAEVEQPYSRAEVALRYAEALLAGGGCRDRAAELLAEARLVAERLGAVPLLAELDKLARRARLRAVPDEAPSNHLTPRERDVLRLLTLGRSNRQIAEELYISTKTASVHVSNILAKLEVSGRGEAAALAHRLGLVEAMAS